LRLIRPPFFPIVMRFFGLHDDVATSASRGLVADKHATAMTLFAAALLRDRQYCLRDWLSAG
jgi:hypothetical protein